VHKVTKESFVEKPGLVFVVKGVQVKNRQEREEKKREI